MHLEGNVNDACLSSSIRPLKSEEQYRQENAHNTASFFRTGCIDKVRDGWRALPCRDTDTSLSS